MMTGTIAEAPDAAVAATAGGAPPALTLSVVVPTFNEVANVEQVVGALRQALAGIAWELVFVDDNSPDGTAAAVRRMARQDLRVRCLQRIGRRGLASACIEGMLASSAPYIAVFDADLQHDERLLPRMLELLERGGTDIVVASRYMAGGRLGNWPRQRVSLSRAATRLGRLVLRADLSDPMSGFFMLTREAMERSVANLSGVGFKILFDLFASSPVPLRFAELAYAFRQRRAGESKLDAQVAWEYLLLILDKLIGHVIPLRLLSFALVGALGAVVHFLILAVLYELDHVDFVISQGVATYVAMTCNFFVNNALTYRDMRLRGRQLLRGWTSFVAICSFGALANVGVAGVLFAAHTHWALSAAAGIVVGTVWNYAVSKAYTWKTDRL
jgi:dolichol-phosphate mannosyltransferase